ncbi:hypothetical protein Pint_07078 [Pistacia integerrima]|uniref:Uncharacterized protein n=1 Tax=Pistacia integerrima TaxID=434235 RepID=A0ACC0XYN8_9ROSI|nr:hypothetical protein Pint_07078 [Pistacia integerrima]
MQGDSFGDAQKNVFDLGAFVWDLTFEEDASGQDVNEMMNQGGNTQTVASLDPNLVENRYVVDASQSQTSYLPSTTSSGAVSWNTHCVDNRSIENGILPNSTYHHEQHIEPLVRNVQDGVNSTSVASSSSLGATAVSQDYSGYTSYPNSRSYPGLANYSGTYYHLGDYQKAGSYPSSAYNNQTNSWNEDNYENYSSHQYSNYPAEAIANLQFCCCARLKMANVVANQVGGSFGDANDAQKNVFDLCGT